MASGWLGELDISGAYFSGTRVYSGTSLTEGWLGEHDIAGPYLNGKLVYSGTSLTDGWLGEHDSSGPYITAITMISGGVRVVTGVSLPSIIDFVTNSSGYAYTGKELAPSTSSVPLGNIVPGTLPGSSQTITV